MPECHKRGKKSMNTIILTNVNAGKDAQVKTLENGTKVATFPVAHSERWHDKDGNKMERTDWFDVVAWRGLAVLAEKAIKKGTRLNVTGTLRNRSWTGTDGQKHFVTEIVANGIEVLSAKQADAPVAAPASAPAAPAPAIDDLPPMEESLDY